MSVCVCVCVCQTKVRRTCRRQLGLTRQSERKIVSKVRMGVIEESVSVSEEEKKVSSDPPSFHVSARLVKLCILLLLLLQLQLQLFL